MQSAQVRVALRPPANEVQLMLTERVRDDFKLRIMLRGPQRRKTKVARLVPASMLDMLANRAGTALLILSSVVVQQNKKIKHTIAARARYEQAICGSGRDEVER